MKAHIWLLYGIFIRILLVQAYAWSNVLPNTAAAQLVQYLRQFHQRKACLFSSLPYMALDDGTNSREGARSSDKLSEVEAGIRLAGHFTSSLLRSRCFLGLFVGAFVNCLLLNAREKLKTLTLYVFNLSEKGTVTATHLDPRYHIPSVLLPPHRSVQFRDMFYFPVFSRSDAQILLRCFEDPHCFDPFDPIKCVKEILPADHSIEKNRCITTRSLCTCIQRSGNQKQTYQRR